MLRVGLVAPLPPQVGGVVSFASWLLEQEDSLDCKFETFDLRRPPELEVGGRWRLDAAARQVPLLASFLRWIPKSPRIVHYCVSLTASGLPRDVLFTSLLRAAGRRTIAHVHGPALDPLSPGAKGRLVGALARLGTARVSVVPLDGWAFVPNPLRLTPVARRASGVGTLRLLSVGAFGPLKGSDVLVESLGRLRREAVTAELRFVGREIRDGDEGALWRQAQAEGVEDAVVFAGELPVEQVVAEYAEADVFCLPSRREGLPMALIEAMACDVPVVASPVGAIPLFVADGETGLLVPVGDSEAVAVAIARLAADAGLRARLGAAGGALVRERCDPKLIAARWRELYREVAA